MHRFDLQDWQWALIEDLFPSNDGKEGEPWRDHRTVLNGMFHVLHTGCAWRDLPERYGPWQTAYDRFNRWRKDGTWAKILDALLLQLDRKGFIGRDLWCFDGTISRAHASAAGAKKNQHPVPRLGGKAGAQVKGPEDHALGRSRGGFSTKTHLACDGRGVLLAVWVTAGRRHESKGLEPAMRRAQRPRRAGRPRWPVRGAGDKGYSYGPVRRWLRRHHIKPVIPTRKDQPRQEDFDKKAYRRRNIIERAVGWLVLRQVR